MNDPWHAHSVPLIARTGTAGAQMDGAWQGGSTATTNVGTGVTIQNSGGAEARPVNVALMPCVKALKTVLVPGGAVSLALALANQAEMEAAVEAAKGVSPAMQKYHPGMAKAWVSFNGANGALFASYNVSGVVRNSVGQYTTTFITPFSGQYRFDWNLHGRHCGLRRRSGWFQYLPRV